MASPVASWNPAEEAIDKAAESLDPGQAPTQQEKYEFEQKLDDNWVVKQTLRYGRAPDQPEGDWVTGSLQPDQDSLQPGLGTISANSLAQATFHSMGLQHGVKFGFDYLKSRDIDETPIAPGPMLDISDAGYGTAIGMPRLVARAYSEQRKLGFYAQDEIQYKRWMLTLVGRRDQLSNRTIDLNSASDSVEAYNGSDILSGRVGLRYRFDSGLEPYVNSSQTYAPGADLAPSRSQQYETGIRFQPAGLGQLMTLTAFNQLQRNEASGSAEAGCVTAGCSAWAELRIRGATVESRLQPMAGLKLMASYALTDSSVTAASAGAYSSVLANRYPQVFEQRVALRARYAITDGSLSGLSLDGRVGRTGASYGGADQTGQASSYTLMDAGINYDFGRLNSNLKGLKLRASANNLFDQEYWSYCYSDACAGGAGRSVSAMLNYRVSWP